VTWKGWRASETKERYLLSRALSGGDTESLGCCRENGSRRRPRSPEMRLPNRLPGTDASGSSGPRRDMAPSRAYRQKWTPRDRRQSEGRSRAHLRSPPEPTTERASSTNGFQFAIDGQMLGKQVARKQGRGRHGRQITMRLLPPLTTFAPENTARPWRAASATSERYMTTRSAVW